MDFRGKRLVIRRQREYAPGPLPPSPKLYDDEILPARGSSIISVAAAVNEQLIEHLTRHPEVLRSRALDPRKFEELVAELWRGFGYDVELTKRTRDGGYDVVAVRSHHIDEQHLIECKHPIAPHKVGVAVVRELYGTVVDRGATKGIVATTEFLSPDAILFVERHKWVLEAKDYDGIQAWMRQYLERKQS